MKKQLKVDEYIKDLPTESAPHFRKVREVIRQILPMGEEVISYGIPTFRIDGKNIVYFAGWKNHVSIYPIPPGSAAFNKKIAPFVKGKGTLQFQLDKPIPQELIKEVVKENMKAYLQRIKETLK